MDRMYYVGRDGYFYNPDKREWMDRIEDAGLMDYELAVKIQGRFYREEGIDVEIREYSDGKDLPVLDPT